MGKQTLGAVVTCAALSLIVLYSSCKKDHDNNSVIGSWEMSKIREVVASGTPPQVISDTSYNYTHGQSFIVTFRSNGQYVSVDYSGTAPDTVVKGVYTYWNSQIITTQNGSSTSDTATADISGNTMTINDSHVSSGTTFSITETFTRQ